jgi:hypothetical protein
MGQTLEILRKAQMARLKSMSQIKRNRIYGKQYLPALLMIWAIGIVILLASSSASEPSPEYLVKAAFLYNFAKFVDWPAEAFKGDPGQFCIGILGADPFGDALKTIQSKDVKGKKIIIKKSGKLGELKGCHLLFVSLSERGGVKEILAQLKGDPVLTVSDMERFAQQGGMIALVKVENQFRFEINATVASGAKLNISSSLLQLGKVVSAGPQ